MECSKCNHEMEIHYGWFCPKCDTDILIMKQKVTGDLFKIMYHMQANGYMSKEKFWRDWFVDSFNFSNDSYVDMTLEDTYDNEELNEYMRKVAELLSVEVGDEVTMWVSW
jgi:hypothetical protein